MEDEVSPKRSRSPYFQPRATKRYLRLTRSTRRRLLVGGDIEPLFAQLLRQRDSVLNPFQRLPELTSTCHPQLINKRHGSGNRKRDQREPVPVKKGSCTRVIESLGIGLEQVTIGESTLQSSELRGSLFPFLVDMDRMSLSLGLSLDIGRLSSERIQEVVATQRARGTIGDQIWCPCDRISLLSGHALCYWHERRKCRCRSEIV